MKLIEALGILRRSPPEGAEKFAVSLLCGFTPLHLQTFLAAELQLLYRDRQVKVRTGLFGDLDGSLKRDAEAESEAAIVVVEWPDLDPRLGLRSLGGWGPQLLPEILENVLRRSSLFVSAIEQLANTRPVVVCLPTLPLPPISYSPGWQASPFETDLRAGVAAMAARLAKLANVRLLNSQHLDSLSPVAERFDVKSDVTTGFPYRMVHVTILAELLARALANPSAKKGLITDLDETVWKGILGEIGLEGVSWDLDHNSQMHGVYQQLLHALSAAGVLVAIASKNDPKLVDEVFSKRSPIISKDKIFPIEAGWGPKSESVSRILKAWNIAPDAVVFVDDSPMELAEVKAAHPGIECIRFPQDDPQGVYLILQQLRDLFGKSALHEEDAFRLDSLRRADSLRQSGELPESGGENFLEQANAEITFSFETKTLDPRALELVNKTNQFNLNGKRHTQVSLQDYVHDPKSFLMVVSYKDKYGPLGKIAVLAGRSAGKKLWIDAWVMSCRAFSRHIEYRCFEELLSKFEADEVEFDFVPTPRNEPVRTFLAGLLGVTPDSTCLLSKNDFLKRQPKMYHRVLELSNG
jgi:FkbH-like protein